ncbi:MAG: Grx4 family monothiol glutaredoxin [Candidatus Eremiobacteraeota bacterium]|nr:Grx4 family monothiol glutaredoxin [Candidatus Eremiobacteraeota bacterium]
MSLSDAMRERLTNDVKNNNVVLYMKGTKDFPMCGFSARAAQVLKAAKVDFADFNILDDNDLRLGLKEFSEWPTFPQCYIKGEFIGGSDILLEMYESGELQEMLKDLQKA